MTETALKPHWQDWTVFGLRWVFLIGISLVIIVNRLQIENGATFDRDLNLAIGIGIVFNLIVGAVIFFPSLRQSLPYVIMLQDWVFTGIFILLAGAEPWILLGVTAPLIIAYLLRFGPIVGSAHALGTVVVAVGILIYDVGMANAGNLVDPYAVPFVTLFLLLGTTGLWIYNQFRQTFDQEKAFNQISSTKEKQLTDMRERAKSMSEMTMTLSSTLEYQKILNAALDIGRLSLRSSAKERGVSIVMLFRSYDDALYIVNSRGLNHIDEHKIIRGKEGIVAKALEDGATVIGKDAFNDPELRIMNAFQGIRSVLVIPLRAHFDNYGVLIYGITTPNAFNEDHLHTLNAIGVQATVALQNAVLYNNLMEEKERIIQLEEDGRKALVRDLHDIPAQTIAAVKMRINVIQRMLERKSSGVMEELKQVEEMSQKANDEIRHVLFKLRPLALESQGLAAALEQLAEKTYKTFGQAVAVRVSPDVEAYLDKSKQGALFYLIEEAVGNARKYAQAQVIKVTIVRQKDVLVVQIADNGRGFDTEEKKEDGRDHFGLINMKERAELLDGTLTLKSAPGKGTTINVIIPVDTSASQDREYAEQLRAQMPETKLAASALSSYGEHGRY